MERFRPIFYVAVLIAALLVIDQAQLQEQNREWVLKDQYTVKVRKVIDGDTVRVQFRNGIKDTVRLLGVDTPETSMNNVSPEEFGYPSTRAGKRRLKRAGEMATQWLKNQIPPGKIVRLRFDRTSDYRGSYNRLLGYVIKGDTNINKRLIKTGAARVYRNAPFSLKRSFIRLERGARKTNRGVWNHSRTTRSDSRSARDPQRKQVETTGDIDCSENSYNCSDFDTYKEALRVFRACGGVENDVHRLDGNDDGEPCESLK